MDGAIRFTQRDALAAVLITGVNIVAGLVIGVVQHGLDLSTAAQTYTILTVGEGLVTSIPALLVSMSGGLITTRASAESNLGEEVADAVARALASPLAVAAAVLVGLALIPGLPKLSFLIVAAVLGSAAYVNRRAVAAEARPPSRRRRQTDNARSASSSVDPLGDRSRLRARHHRRRDAGRHAARRACGRSGARSPTETGLVVPSVHVADNLQLGPRTYSILVKGVEVARGELFVDRLLAINPGTVERRHRRHRRRASRRSACRPSGFRRTGATRRSPPATPSSIRRRRSRRTCRRSSARSCRICSRASRRRSSSIASARRRRSSSRSSIPKIASVGDVQRVLRQLLARARAGARSHDDSRSHGRRARRRSRIRTRSSKPCAQALGRSVCRAYQTDNGELRVIALSPALEDALAASLTQDRPRRAPGRRPGAGAEPAPRSSGKCSPRKTWHNLCSCAHRRCVRTCGGCSRGRCRTSRCCRTTKCLRRCGWSRSRRWTDMHVKRLYGPTVRDALAAAREELGPGALVLSTELVPATGWRGWIGQRVVRLTAAAERAAADAPSRAGCVGKPATATGAPTAEADDVRDGIRRQARRGGPRSAAGRRGRRHG